MKSEKIDGRSVISSAASGLFKVETLCSAIASSMGNAPDGDKVKYTCVWTRDPAAGLLLSQRPAACRKPDQVFEGMTAVDSRGLLNYETGL